MTNNCNSVIIDVMIFFGGSNMKKRFSVTVIIPLIVIAVISMVIIIVGKVLEITGSNKTEISLTDYYKLPEGEARLVIDLIKMDENALIKNKTAYLPYSIAEDMVPRLFYDNLEDVLLYTTATEKYLYKTDEKEYRVNGKTETDEVASFIDEGGNIYVSIDFIAKWHDMKADVFENPGRIIIFNENNAEYEYVEVKKNTELREGGDKKEAILKEVAANDKVYLLEGTNNKFTRVFTEDGVTGYIETSDLDTKNVEKKKYSFDREKEDIGYTSISREEPIVFGWHQVTNEAANSGWSSVIAEVEGLNVISPTWLSVADSTGELTSFASNDYVSKMHNLKIDVWPLINDFNKDVDYKKLLTNTTNRTNLINNIVYFVETYDFDGINVDFENIKSSYAKGYIQFLRELSIAMRKRNKVLSIDNYIPLEFNSFYNVKEQGILADYLCVMAYDEHYSGSKEAGSVSSLSWVKNSIEKTAESAPMEKLIIGLPFYTRVWREKENGKLTSKALGMNGGLNIVSSSKADKKWDDETGQYYAEWKEGSDVLKVWLEEEKSIAAKLGAIEKDKVAGIAFWKLGLERKEVWNSITDWLK